MTLSVCLCVHPAGFKPHPDNIQLTDTAFNQSSIRALYYTLCEV